MACGLSPEQLRESLSILIELLDVHGDCANLALKADIRSKVTDAIEALNAMHSPSELSEMIRGEDTLVDLLLTGLLNRLAREDMMELPGATGLKTALLGHSTKEPLNRKRALPSTLRP